MPDSLTEDDRFDWIEAMTDDECMEVFWLYVDPPEPFLARHPPALLGAAMRRALREIAKASKAQAEESRPRRR